MINKEKQTLYKICNEIMLWEQTRFLWDDLIMYSAMAPDEIKNPKFIKIAKEYLCSLDKTDFKEING